MTSTPTRTIARLRVLGPVSVEFAGPDGEGARLTQPRLLGLLAFLLLARPRGLQSRDKVIAMFWPESDAAAGRQGLRNSLHRLRAALGSEAVVTAGDHLVGIDPARVSCDALELEAGDDAHGGAIELWGGDLLDGFHVSNAPEFERWLEGERHRVRGIAVKDAWDRAHTYMARGDHARAATAARFAMELSPSDEHSIRRLLELLDATGDRAGALQAFDRFARTLRNELDVEPSPATLAIVEALRQPRAPIASPQPLLPRPAMPAVAALQGRDASRRFSSRAVAVIAACILLPASWLVVRGRTASPVDGPLASSRIVRRDAALPARYRADTAAFRQYLLGVSDLDEGRVTSARRRFQGLVDEHPLYPPAWAGHSVALYRSGFADIPPRSAMPAALSAAQHALAMDSSLADAQETMAAVALFANWNLAESRRRLDAALAQHPDDADLLNLLGIWYRWSGDQEAALRLKQRAHEIDPLSRRYAMQVAWSYYLGHRCDDAVREYRRLPPELRVTRAGTPMYRSLRCAGRTGEAAAFLGETERASGDSALAGKLAGSLTPPERDRLVDNVFRRQLARALSARQAGWTPPENITRLYAERQVADSTLMWIDSMYVDRSMMLYTVPFDPLYDFLHGDARFTALLGKMTWLARARPRP